MSGIERRLPGRRRPFLGSQRPTRIICARTPRPRFGRSWDVLIRTRVQLRSRAAGARLRRRVIVARAGGHERRTGPESGGLWEHAPEEAVFAAGAERFGSCLGFAGQPSSRERCRRLTVAFDGEGSLADVLDSGIAESDQ